MKSLPNTKLPLILRTDFTNQTAWEAIRLAVGEGAAEFFDEIGMESGAESVEYLDDVAYRGMNKDQLLELIPKNYVHSFIFVVDRKATSNSGYPVLVVDLYDDVGDEFRSIASQIYTISANLSIANMDFTDFTDAVDEDGVFRGFVE